MDILFIIAGLVLLFFGGEGLVRGSVGLAERLRISALLVSLIVVGFGTSAPELIVSIKAALSGSPDLALGNVVGSNIANTFLIVGLAAALKPIASGGFGIRRDALAVIAASLILVGFSYFDYISRLAGALMLVVLLGYMFMAYRQEKRVSAAEQAREHELEIHIVEEVHSSGDSAVKSGGLVVTGLVMLVIGAELLVTGASSVARTLGISEAVIGLSLVALGTSLPELTTAVIASLKGHSDVVIGNVLGSNLFNVLGILGVTAMLAPLPLTGRIVEVDLWLMLGTSFLLFWAIRSGQLVSRVEGAAFLGLYAAYLGLMFAA